jgi:glycosyltransferase involved in cell wall biosynthesis
MRCPSLNELPPPPNGKTGWPWTAESAQLPDLAPNGLAWPKLSIVTPSYNQGAFLEATLRSILLQGYPNLDYIVIDGGSTDESVDIIRKYEPWLSYWASEPDEGQYHAINKGFAVSTGQIMSWLNSDDMYMLNSFGIVGQIFTTLNDTVQWITGITAYWDANDILFGVRDHPRYSRRFIRLGFNDGRKFRSIQQESTFWSRSLWELAGGFVDNRMRFAADFDLWRRFACHADLYLASVVLGGFRVHFKQKTVPGIEQYYEEVDHILSGSNWVWWLNKLASRKTAQRIISLYQKVRRDYKIIAYNPITQRWEIER